MPLQREELRLFKLKSPTEQRELVRTCQGLILQYQDIVCEYSAQYAKLHRGVGHLFDLHEEVKRLSRLNHELIQGSKERQKCLVELIKLLGEQAKATNEQLKATNEQLKATNEQLRVVSEREQKRNEGERSNSRTNATISKLPNIRVVDLDKQPTGPMWLVLTAEGNTPVGSANADAKGRPEENVQDEQSTEHSSLSLWQQKALIIAKDIKISKLNHRLCTTRHRQAMLEANFSRPEEIDDGLQSLVKPGGETLEAVKSERDQLRLEQTFHRAIIEAQNNRFSELEDTIKEMEASQEQIMNSWSRADGPSEGLVLLKEQYEISAAQMKKQLQVEKVGLEVTVAGLQKRCDTLVEKHQLVTHQKEAENDCHRKELSKKEVEIDCHIEELRKKEAQKDCHSEELNKKEAEMEDCKQKIKRQGGEITKIQQTVRTQKTELANYKSLIENMTREHEAELGKEKSKYEKFKPLVVSGGHLRNRHMEKSKFWAEQDPRLKETGNTAAHTGNAAADALLYESDLPIPPRTDSAYFKQRYKLDHKYVVEKCSLELAEVISWNTTMKAIASDAVVCYDMSRFDRAFGQIMSARGGDDDFDFDEYVMETNEGRMLYEILSDEYHRARANEVESHVELEKEKNSKPRKVGRKNFTGAKSTSS